MIANLNVLITNLVHSNTKYYFKSEYFYYIIDDLDFLNNLKKYIYFKFEKF